MARSSMARSSDPKKVALWQGRFRRFIDFGLPVSRFCKAEQVSESSFYYWLKKLDPPYWLKKLGSRGRGRAMSAEDHAPGCGDSHGSTSVYAEDRSVFRPVTVVAATCGVVVRLPSGARIEVDASQLDAVRAVVAETLRADVPAETLRADVPAETIRTDLPAETVRAAHDRTVRRNRLSESPAGRQRGDVLSC